MWLEQLADAFVYRHDIANLRSRWYDHDFRQKIITDKSYELTDDLIVQLTADQLWSYIHTHDVKISRLNNVTIMYGISRQNLLNHLAHLVSGDSSAWPYILRHITDPSSADYLLKTWTTTTPIDVNRINFMNTSGLAALARHGDKTIIKNQHYYLHVMGNLMNVTYEQFRDMNEVMYIAFELITTRNIKILAYLSIMATMCQRLN